MDVQQISVFLENKTGRLSEVTGALTDAGVNIRALAVADTSDFGVLRLIVDDTAGAVQCLKEGGFTVTTTEVVAVRVPDRPGGLHRILEVVRDAGINIEYMYAFVDRKIGDAMMIFRFDRIDKALDVLDRAAVTVVGADALAAG